MRKKLIIGGCVLLFIAIIFFGLLSEVIRYENKMRFEDTEYLVPEEDVESKDDAEDYDDVEVMSIHSIDPNASVSSLKDEPEIVKLTHEQYWVPNFLKKKANVNILTENDKAYIDKAILYLLTKTYLKDMFFLGYNLYILPNPKIVKHVVESQYDEDADESIFSTVEKGYFQPIEEADFLMDFFAKVPGVYSYTSIVSYLSQNRRKVDFFNLYEGYKSIIHNVITYDVYLYYELDMIVDALIRSRDDFQSGACSFKVVEEIMDGYTEDNLVRGKYVSNSDYYSSFQKIVPASSLQYFHSDEIDTSSMVVWAYSFWMRRNKEGNIDNVYSTLKSIRNDYKRLEKEELSTMRD